MSIGHDCSVNLRKPSQNAALRFSVSPQYDHASLAPSHHDQEPMIPSMCSSSCWDAPSSIDLRIRYIPRGSSSSLQKFQWIGYLRTSGRGGLWVFIHRRDTHSLGSYTHALRPFNRQPVDHVARTLSDIPTQLCAAETSGLRVASRVRIRRVVGTAAEALGKVSPGVSPRLTHVYLLGVTPS